MSKLKTLKVNPIIGTVTLTDGATTVDVPKLDMTKIIKIAKFLGVDGMKIYADTREILLNDDMETLERIVLVVESLKEEQLIEIIAIALGLPAQEALKLDLNEMLDVLIVIAENTNLQKTYSQVRTLANLMFGANLPDLGKLYEQAVAISDRKDRVTETDETAERESVEL